ncbi:MAG TPA: PD-(D/E)XK nuclease family protein, partial [Acidimicrobiales bacterium]
TADAAVASDDPPQLPFDTGDVAEAADVAAVVSPPASGVRGEQSGHDGDDHDDDETDDPEAGLEKRPRDLDLPPWLKGRYGTAVGRAVHGVLQTIDLGTGAGRDAAVAAQCQAEAIGTRADDVARLVQLALDSPVVREAAANAHWREVYACTPVAGRLLEGYVDLLYRGPDGLVVVDYKTAGTTDPTDLAQRVEGYRLQGASYALSVAQTTGEPVHRVVFLFLTPGGAVSIDLADVPAAVAEVEDLVARGAERVLS